MKKSKHGGAREGAGPKTTSETGEIMKIRPIRMTDQEWEDLKKLGGAKWVREQIRKAIRKLTEI